MRFLFRVTILGLAAVGARSLYERFAPKVRSVADHRDDFSRSAHRVAGEVQASARKIGAEAREAVQSVATTAADELGVTTETTGRTHSGADTLDGSLLSQR